MSASACSPMRASSSLYGSPATEKIGSFWDSTSELKMSIMGMPVSTIWSGIRRRTGLTTGEPRSIISPVTGPRRRAAGRNRRTRGPASRPKTAPASAGGGTARGRCSRRPGRARKHLQADLLPFQADDLGQGIPATRSDDCQFVVAHAAGVDRHHVAGDPLNCVEVFSHACRPLLRRSMALQAVWILFRFMSTETRPGKPCLNLSGSAGI